MRNIMLIYGGESVERDISVLTAMQMYATLKSGGYNIIPIFMYEGKMYTSKSDKFLDAESYADISKLKKREVYIARGGLNIVRKLVKDKYVDVECALICSHGGEGECGELQGLLDVNGIAYTSPDVAGCAVCMDKAMTHALLNAYGIQCVDYLSADANEALKGLDEIMSRLGESLVIKPNSLGSSIGVGFAYDRESAYRAIEAAAVYDERVIIEKKVENMCEYNCAVAKIDGSITISDIERPISKHEVLDFADKYMATGKMSDCGRQFPADISKELESRIKETSLKAFKRLSLKGVVRIDYLYDSESDELYLNEINAVPGSLAFYLFRCQGIDCQTLLEGLIEQSIADKLANRSIKKTFESGVLINRKKMGANKLQKV